MASTGSLQDRLWIRSSSVLAIDAVNEKFGKGALVYEDAAREQTSKIAFQRVPEVKEF